LMRSTSFDRRQIAAWVDEALLVVNLSKYRELEEQGITGAMDLAWYAWGTPGSRDLEALAKAAGVDAHVLRDTAVRLSEDAQLRIVWTLYQIDSDTEPDPARDDREQVYRTLGRVLGEAKESPVNSGLGTPADRATV